MKLKSLSQSKLNTGEVLVGRGLFSQPDHQLKFVMIEKINESFIYIQSFSAIFDDSDESDTEALWHINIADCHKFLAQPLLEVGDLLIHRGRPAQIMECREGDWHVKIKYTDTTGGEFYGNLVWMNLSPTLDLIDLDSAWPALA